MQCLFCKRQISLFRRFKNSEFCSSEHQSKFLQQSTRMVAERILTNSAHRNVSHPVKPIAANPDLVEDVQVYCPPDDLILAALADNVQFDAQVAATNPGLDYPMRQEFLNLDLSIGACGPLNVVEPFGFTSWNGKPRIPRLAIPWRMRRRLSGLALQRPTFHPQSAGRQLHVEPEWLRPEMAVPLHLVIPARLASWLPNSAEGGCFHLQPSTEVPGFEETLKASPERMRVESCGP